MRTLYSLLGTAVLATAFCAPADAAMIGWQVTATIQSVDSDNGLLPRVPAGQSQPQIVIAVTWDFNVEADQPSTPLRECGDLP